MKNRNTFATATAGIAPAAADLRELTDLEVGDVAGGIVPALLYLAGAYAAGKELGEAIGSMLK